MIRKLSPSCYTVWTAGRAPAGRQAGPEPLVEKRCNFQHNSWGCVRLCCSQSSRVRHGRQGWVSLQEPGSALFSAKQGGERAQKCQRLLHSQVGCIQTSACVSGPASVAHSSGKVRRGAAPLCVLSVVCAVWGEKGRCHFWETWWLDGISTRWLLSEETAHRFILLSWNAA